MKVKAKGQKKTGFAGWVFLFTFAIIAASYFLAGTDPVLLGDGKTWATDVTDLTLSDVCLYSIYALFLVAILCALLSMCGIFKARK